jgi:hypothetical protein
LLAKREAASDAPVPTVEWCEWLEGGTCRVWADVRLDAVLGTNDHRVQLHLNAATAAVIAIVVERRHLPAVVVDGQVAEAALLAHQLKLRAVRTAAG